MSIIVRMLCFSLSLILSFVSPTHMPKSRIRHNIVGSHYHSGRQHDPHMKCVIEKNIYISAMAETKGAISWYVKRNSENKQPMLDAAQRVIEKYNTFYLDPDHGDNSSEKVIYLTFDAGYENGNVEKILDVLKEKNVSAAFFILKNVIVKHAPLVKRMADEGHFVCNHTVDHRDMSKVNDGEEFKKELECLEKIYSENIGGEMKKFFRPPEGRFNEDNLRFADELGYSTILWSFAYDDWDNGRQPSLNAAKKKILDNTHNGAIILLHPTSDTNAAILGELIDVWRSMGYSFGTLDMLPVKREVSDIVK